MTPAFQYAIQCDKLQQRTSNGPQIWATLMNNAHRISIDEFEEACDLSGLLDEGETLDEFTSSDEGSGAYRVEAGPQTYYFLQTSGFEFFFTQGGVTPTFVEPFPRDWHEYNSSAQARLLLPANHPLLQGTWGIERDDGPNEEDFNVIISGNGSVRYQLLDGNRVVAGIRVESGEVSDIYTCRDRRREGLASLMLEMVRRQHGPTPLSASLTDDGKAFKAGFLRAKRRDKDEELEM